MLFSSFKLHAWGKQAASETVANLKMIKKKNIYIRNCRKKEVFGSAGIPGDYSRKRSSVEKNCVSIVFFRL